MDPASALLDSARRLRDAASGLSFSAPVTHVYNPLSYAWEPHSAYLEAYGKSRKRTVFVGMNPGPWGMAQTGIPFGEVSLVRDWIGIHKPVAKPSNEHPRRPVEGFACPRSEVSGRRLWGLFAERFKSAERFFAEHFVANYCPLVFMEESGRNRTPDKLPRQEVQALYSLCDEHLRTLVEVLSPKWVVAVGAFAEERAISSLRGMDVQVLRILHPSPASPAANRDWAGVVERQLKAAGVWDGA